AGAEALLQRMMERIRYRGPDEDGTYLDRDLGVGHLRLTIVAPDGGHQPRVERDSGDLLVFNGEIYDFREHGRWLQSNGVTLRDGSDTEVLFQMIRLLGVEAAVDKLDGMFAFAYRDGSSGALYLVRDRFGEKPLFFAKRSGALIFASEIKSLLQHPALTDADFDHGAIEAYLSLDYVPAPKTGLSGVEKLRPGEIVKFQNGNLQKSLYWIPNLPSAGGPTATPGDIDAQADQLTVLLDQSIQSRLIADVPVGLFLSGGLDSALIAARASKFAPGITAYTIRFDGDGYDETPYAAEVANQFGLRHEICDVGKQELFAAIDAIEARMDEPFADNSIIPTYLLCQAARRDVTVALGGDGGDELFAGYMNFQAQMGSPVLAAMPKALRSLPRAMCQALPVKDDYMGLGFKIGQLLNGWGEPAKYQPMKWMSAFNSAELQSLLTQASSSDALVAAVDSELRFSEPTDALERLQYLFCRLYLANDILTKVDRASMYHSLEVRAPFLARPLAEFAFSLPGPMKIRGLQTKRILRHLGRRWLPKTVTERAKHGFALPVASLIRGHLAEPIAETLFDRSNPMTEYFSTGEIKRLVDEHKASRRDHRKRIWSLYCLFLFARNMRAS
ncbi:MAG: asparagine synthase (glutamine-hydrolyzing), partial [Boseongicola sp.]